MRRPRTRSNGAGMAHARVVTISMPDGIGETVGGPRLVTVFPEGRTRGAISAGRYVSLVQYAGDEYLPVGPSDLVDVVRAAADSDETVEQARTRRGNPDFTLPTTIAGRMLHDELGLQLPPRPDPIDVSGQAGGRL